MQFTAQQIASLLNGTVEGNPEAAVSALAKIEEAGAGSLSFLANKIGYNNHNAPMLSMSHIYTRPTRRLLL